MTALPLLEANAAPAPTDDHHFGALTSVRGSLPLSEMAVRGRIDGLIAETTVRQTFVNSFREPIEATYIFPLPDRAAVVHFEMTVGGRVVAGVLKERGAARREYRQAIDSGKRAAITEEERPGVFTMRVGNLMPGDEAVVELRLVGPLPWIDGEVTFRFPLVVAPRYMPGVPVNGRSVGAGTASDTDAVPDASRISPPVLLPGYPNPVWLSLAVDIAPGSLEVTDLRSSLHAVEETASADGGRRVRVHPGERLDRDFVLRYRLGGADVQSSLTVTSDAADPAVGSFMLTLLPPTAALESQRPRDVVFILDRSGSMSGWKMVAARRALARMIDTLTPADRFTVYAFDDSIELPPGFPGSGVLTASDRNRFRASEWLMKVESRGGTEMAQPLGRAVSELHRASSERDRILVLVTDGQVGNEDQILKHIGPSLQGLRVFTLGVDRAVNEAFLKRLALLGGGACDVVESEDRLDAVMDKVHRRIGTAVCTGLRLRADHGWTVDGDSLVPGRLPDLFVGAPLVVLGRYTGERPGAVVVESRDAADRPWAQRVEGRPTSGKAVAAAWARGRVRDLEDRYATGQGDRAWLERCIVATSLKFGVLCRFTAYVAVDRVVANTTGKVQPVVQAVEQVAGSAMRQKEQAASRKIRKALPGVYRAVPRPGARLAAPPPSNAKADPPADAAAMPDRDEATQESIDSMLADFTDTAIDLNEKNRGAVPGAGSAASHLPPADSDEDVEFELTLDDGPDANSGAPAPKTLRGKLSDLPEEASEFELSLEAAPAAPESAGEEKDIFETDFELPALDDEDSESQVVALEAGDTDLESSDFDLAVDIDSDISEQSEVVELPEDSLDQPKARRRTSGLRCDDSHFGGIDQEPTDEELEDEEEAKGGSLWEGLKKAADAVRQAFSPTPPKPQPLQRLDASIAPPAQGPPPSEPKSGDPAQEQPQEEIRQLTTDHDLRNACVTVREIPPEEVRDYTFRNVLWKYLGSKEVGDGPDVLEIPITTSDRFLLCTDGLTDIASDDAILRFVRQNPDAQTCAEGLGKLALDSGSRDNVSCIVVNFDGGNALDVGRCTLLGNHRTVNADAIDFRRFGDWTVCAVADGITGTEVGTLSSQHSVSAILRELGQHLPAADSGSRVKETIRVAIVQANQEIIVRGASARELKNMGATIVLTAWKRGTSVMYVTNVGDSRCYHIPAGQTPNEPQTLAPAAYRDRARRLADDLARQPADDAGRLHQLGVLAVKLAELVADLQSVGVPEADYRPLVRLLADLRALTGRTDAPAAKLSQMTVAAMQVLRDFAGPAAPAGREEAFWK